MALISQSDKSKLGGQPGHVTCLPLPTGAHQWKFSHESVRKAHANSSKAAHATTLLLAAPDGSNTSFMKGG